MNAIQIESVTRPDHGVQEDRELAHAGDQGRLCEPHARADREDPENASGRIGSALVINNLRYRGPRLASVPSATQPD
jgi:hypothetical protein